MNADRLTSRIVSAFILILALAWTLPACLPLWDAPTATPTFFHPPSGRASPATPPSNTQPAAATPIIFPTETFTPAPTEIIPTPPCTNKLSWLADLTFEDDTSVLLGQSIDKQWMIKNSGTCDWDARYKLRNINNETLGMSAEISLYPARAGAQVTLRIVFLAPSAAGTYRSEWQAVSPDGALFGDTVYIQIIVRE